MSFVRRSIGLIAFGTCLALLSPQGSSAQEASSIDRFSQGSWQNDARSRLDDARSRARERTVIRDETRLIRPPVVSRPPQRPVQGEWQLGIHADTTSAGMLVTSVVRGSAADRAGLERGDRILSVGYERVGLIGNRNVSMRNVLRRQADLQGDVVLLIQPRRGVGLSNVTVRLERVAPPQFFSN